METFDKHAMWRNVRAGIDSIPAMLQDLPPEYLNEMRRLPALSPTALYLVGCGDSHYAGLATQDALANWSGCPVHAIQSMEFSRYAVKNAPAGAVVVCVSNSGRVARTHEALLAARQRGLTTVAITYRGVDEAFARDADHVFVSRYPDTGLGVGTGSTIASIISLYIVGLWCATNRGVLDDIGVSARVGEMRRAGERLARTLTAVADRTAELASFIAPSTPLFILGAGPNFASAFIGQAKMIEMNRHNTVAVQLEEWAHEQYFLCGPGTVTGFVGLRGAPLTRVREEARAVALMNGRSFAVVEETDLDTIRAVDIALEVDAGTPDEFAPLVAAPVLMQLAYQVAVANDNMMLGFDDPLRLEVNTAQIFHSQIET